jgi:hypothetical protein
MPGGSSRAEKWDTKKRKNLMRWQKLAVQDFRVYVELRTPARDLLRSVSSLSRRHLPFLVISGGVARVFSFSGVVRGRGTQSRGFSSIDRVAKW